MTQHEISRPRRRDRVLVTRVSGRMALFDLDAGTYYELNEVGGRIWELCDGSRDVPDLVTVIHDEYDAPAEVVETDVAELLAELARENLIIEGS